MNAYSPLFDELLNHLLGFMQMPKEFGPLLFQELKGPFTTDTHLSVLKPGEISQMAFWPVHGYLRRYKKYKPQPDREYEADETIDISIPRKIYLSSNSFMNQTPVDFHLEIRKGTTYIGFLYSSFIEMGQRMPEVFLLAGKILAEAEKDWLEKIEICKVNTKEAYEKFSRHFHDPTAEKFILQKQIANYIGKSEEELSRIIHSEK